MAKSTSAGTPVAHPSVPSERKPSNGHPGENPKITVPADISFSQDTIAPSPLKSQLRQLLQTVKAVRQGNFSVRFPEGDGIVNEIGEVLNDIIELNEDMAGEFARVAK